MLRTLQIAFLLALAAFVACFSAWRYFSGGTWWLPVIGALLTYAALLSSFFWGSSNAWHKKSIQFVFSFALSTASRAIFSLVVLLGITVYFGVLAYKSLPADTAYYEVRVYENVDLPANYLVGVKVTVHSRTDGLTHVETVGDDGAAIFRSLSVPTTLTYQLEVISAKPPFVTADSVKIDRLPDLLAIDVASIPDEKRQLLEENFIDTGIDVIPRPENYLVNIDERGDTSLQAENAPWGVPDADLILNRLGYVLGYDLERKLPRWVAYSIGPTEQVVERSDDFKPDPAISPDKQASMSDYSRSGYDRGHLISPVDLYFKGPLIVQEAYYLSTLTPQTPWFNRSLWRDIERRVRDVVSARQQPVFIIAGPLFIVPEGNPDFEFNTIGDGQIPVPTHFFRIVAIANEYQGVDAFGLIAPNDEDGEELDLNSYIVPISEIEKISGLIFFPFLDPQLAATIKNNLEPLW